MSSSARSLYSNISSKSEVNETHIQLFAWGDNANCSCSLPNNTHKIVKSPTTVFKQEKNKPATWLSTVRQMCTGRAHSLFLTVDGKVLACGANNKLQCGLYEDQAGGFLPRLVRMKKRITCISAGGDHSIWVTEDGEVWGAGASSRGQLGRTEPVPMASKLASKLQSSRNQMSPIQRNIDLTDIIWASCGQNYTILLTKNEELYAMGDNTHGQLGCGSKSPIVKIPQKVLLRPRPGIGLQLKKIRAGSSHTIYLTHDGYVFVCGSNEFGQLGFSRDVMDHSQPTLLPPQMFGNLAILDIACGLNHSVFLTQNHTVFVCGSNVHGECGLGKQHLLSVFQPSTIPNFFCKSIHCGALHSFFLKRDNTLWGCGLNESAQVGVGNTTNQHSPQQVHFENDDDPNLRITKVSCGFGDFSLVTKVHVVPQATPKVTPPMPQEEEEQQQHPDLSELDNLLRDIEAVKRDIHAERESHQDKEKELNKRLSGCLKKFQAFCSPPRVEC